MVCQRGFTVLAPDMIGIGEIGQGDFRGDEYIGGISNDKWFSSILIGRSIVGIQASDVVRLIQLLKKNIVTGEIYGVARKEMAPVLLHAAAFVPTITRVALIEPYSSYRSLVKNRYYNSDFVYSTVPGALKAYDLPDLAASLAPRKLLMANITDELGKSADPKNMMDELSIIKAAYHDKRADEQLSIPYQVSSEKLYNFFSEWIK